MISRIMLLAAIVVFIGAALIGCSKSQGGNEINLEGSTTVTPLAEKWADAFKKDHDVKINITGDGSGKGINALINGTVECAMASRPMTDGEKKQCKDKGFEAVEHLIAWDGLTIVVSKDNPLDEVTTDQLLQIYTGSPKNWKDVFPNVNYDKALIVISRDQNSGTFQYFHDDILGKKEFGPNVHDYLGSNQEIVDRVAASPGGIGYVGLGYYLANKDKLKALKVKNEKDGQFYESTDYNKYPFVRQLYLYTKGQPKGALDEFIKFGLSDNGQKIAQDNGFIRIADVK